MKLLKTSLNNERQGEVIIFLEAILWSLFPVVTVLSFKNVSTILALAWSTLFAALFFLLIIIVKKKWSQLVNRGAIRDILLATIILGILYYFFYFFGLRFTSPGNASLIALTEVFFSFLFFNVWRKEYISAFHIGGAVLMLVGAAIVLYPNVHKLQFGDLLIIISAVIAPLGNFFQRRARKQVDSEVILFIRSTISAIVIFILAYFTRQNFGSLDIKNFFLFLIINGFFLLGLSKYLWIEGIHRINVMKANALNGIGPLLTLFFSWLLLNTLPTGFQLVSFIPMFFGVILLSKNNEIKIVNK
jgi:drug/metabolite transporter (DMT)-like permease